MLDIKFVAANPDFVRERLRSRGLACDLEPLLSLRREQVELLKETETGRAQRTKYSKMFSKGGEGLSPDEIREKVKRIGEEVKPKEERLREVEAKIEEMMLGIPNLPHESVPNGKDSNDNLVVRQRGEKPQFSFRPLPHWEVGEALGILDFERAAKIAGPHFPLYRGQGAALERAVMSFMLDLHTQEHGYTEVITPYLVNRESMTATGQLPKFEAESFRIVDPELYLIPTAEVPVTNLHREEILDGAKLPLKYVSFSPCFRRESGGYGKDTKGLMRNHQFHKVELVKFVKPEDSFRELELLTADAEEVLRRLGLHYRIVELCTGDLGANAAKCYDLEVWLPGEAAYREISSCSNFLDYQARRARIRFRRARDAKPELVHTLNGSGLAIGRTVIAILENCQRQDGSVSIPDALHPYMRCTEIRPQ